MAAVGDPSQIVLKDLATWERVAATTDLGFDLHYSRPSSTYNSGKPLHIISTSIFGARKGNRTHKNEVYFEGLKATIEGLDVLPWLRGWVLRIYVDASTMGLGDVSRLLDENINHPQVQVVAVNCPMGNGNGANTFSRCTHRNLFMTVARFFPLVDPDVAVCIVRNVKQCPGPLDMFTVAYWLHHAKRQFMLYDVDDYSLLSTVYSRLFPWQGAWRRIPAFFGFRRDACWHTSSDEAQTRAHGLLGEIMKFMENHKQLDFQYGIDEAALTHAFHATGITHKGGWCFDHAFIVPVVQPNSLKRSYETHEQNAKVLFDKPDERTKAHPDVQYLQHALGTFDDNALLRLDDLAGLPRPFERGRIHKLADEKDFMVMVEQDEGWVGDFDSVSGRNVRTHQAKRLYERFGCSACASVVGELPVEPPPSRKAWLPIPSAPSRKRVAKDEQGRDGQEDGTILRNVDGHAMGRKRKNSNKLGLDPPAKVPRKTHFPFGTASHRGNI
jgi:hypothetical protein